MNRVGVLRCALRAVVASSVVVASGVAGCANRTLASPVVIGASVSDGAASVSANAARVDGAVVEHGVVDLATALDAWIVAAHGRVASSADSTAFLDPVASVREQVTTARRERRTLVFAVDALFWSLYATATNDDDRLARFAETLAALGSLDAPVLVGDVPDMRAAAGRLLRAAQLPSEDARRRANAELRAWAAERPNVTLLPLADLVERAGRGGPIELRGRTFAGDDARRLIAEDRLHATADGTLALAASSLDALVAAGVVDAAAIRPTWRDAESALAPQRVASTQESSAARNIRREQATADLNEYMRFVGLERDADRDAIDCGIALVASCPTSRGPSCEASVVRALAKRWPETTAKLEDMQSAASQRRAREDLVVWSLVAVGLGDVESMRESARAWNDAARAEGDRAYDPDGSFFVVATRVFAELTRADAASAGTFWPDPQRVAKAWQLAWERDAALIAAADRIAAREASGAGSSRGLRAPPRESPRARAVALESSLRAAGRIDDANRLRAMLPSLASGSERAADGASEDARGTGP
ncbi:MAG: hypothetical protein U0572_06910 [Phycisphaerales bacterium]